MTLETLDFVVASNNELTLLWSHIMRILLFVIWGASAQSDQHFSDHCLDSTIPYSKLLLVCVQSRLAYVLLFALVATLISGEEPFLN